MANTDPTGGGETVALTLTSDQRRYLRWVLCSCKGGREDDLRTHPDHPNAGRWRADAAAYGRLIAGIGAGEVFADADARRLVRELADATDREEEYERVVAEHAALLALREQIGAGR